MDRSRAPILLLVAVLAASGACAKPRFSAAQKLGGRDVPAAVLNHGHEVYTHYCYACHGERGDGRGPSAPGMRPPPRDFRPALFKFGGVAVGELPHDEDLAAILRRGLDGTPMLPWDMTEPERHAVVQYIKTFSDRWKTETPGERVLPDGPDPFAGREEEAIEEGRRLYHLSGVERDAGGNVVGLFAGCNVCHPSYMTRADLATLAQQALGAPLSTFPERWPQLKDTDYAAGNYKVKALPTDFLFQPVKTGAELESLFRTIGAGIAGAAMPTWKGGLKDDDLWALAYYVKSLADARGTGAALNLAEALTRDAATPYSPPPTAPNPTPGRRSR